MATVLISYCDFVTQELLDTPTTQTDTAQRFVIATLAMVLVVIFSVVAIYQVQRSEPYVRNVLELSGDPAQGKVIFQMNCAVCHGIDAQGLVGPDLNRVASRKSRVGLIHQVTSGKTPPMPQFQPDPQTMADLLEYLERL
jgi:mono/diheme cytochrome c family protein